MKFTYLYFHLIFVLPLILVMLALCVRHRPSTLPSPTLGIALMSGVALLYTAPWDNYLVYRGVWTYGPGAVVESMRIGYVPMEEYLFFILQTVLTGLFYIYYAETIPSAIQTLRTNENVFSALSGLLMAKVFLVGACVFLLGLGALQLWPEHALYGVLIILWAVPVFVFHWGVGTRLFYNARELFWRAWLAPTVYLWVVDRLAIGWNIWTISPRFSSGWTLLGLPLEELLFFAVTNALVVQGLTIYFWILFNWRSSQMNLAR